VRELVGLEQGNWRAKCDENVSSEGDFSESERWYYSRSLRARCYLQLEVPDSSSCPLPSNPLSAQDITLAALSGVFFLVAGVRISALLLIIVNRVVQG